MRVLTVIANPNPKSFDHALLAQLSKGLTDAGHEVQGVDLYAIHFDPVFTQRDLAQFLDRTVPDELLAQANLKDALITQAGGPLRRALARSALRDKSMHELVDIVRAELFQPIARPGVAATSAKSPLRPLDGGVERGEQTA